MSNRPSDPALKRAPDERGGGIRAADKFNQHFTFSHR
jgi:hypothetical protein